MIDENFIKQLLEDPEAFRLLKKAFDAHAASSKQSRIDNMVVAYKNGKTLQEIADENGGISRERVRQLLKKAGVSREDGGVHVRVTESMMATVRKKKEVKDGKIKEYEQLFGCSYDVVCEINGGPFKYGTRDGIAYKFFTQKRNAKLRGIGFELTLSEWWKIWTDSGMWDKRGRGDGYCMARIGDIGPYSVDNVEIITIGQNFSDSYYLHPSSVRISKRQAQRESSHVFRS